MQIIEVVNRHVPAPCSECFITNTTNENKKANGTSIMQVVCLGSLPGHELLVEVHAFDEETATTACKEIAYYISCINESGD
jgi:phosphotransferase system HPr-like phosphotransfer protein